MRITPISDAVRKAWKLFPLRLTDNSTSKCCGARIVLVQSLEGGFVTRNCSKCGHYEMLTTPMFRGLHLWVACPECNRPMDAATLPDSNYGYECTVCDIGIRLADLLPKWTDL